MQRQDDDLSELLKYKFQLNFDKLVNVIQNKSDAINAIIDEIADIREHLKELKEEKDSLANTLKECQEQCSQNEVSILCK